MMALRRMGDVGLGGGQLGVGDKRVMAPHRKQRQPITHAPPRHTWPQFKATTSTTTRKHPSPDSGLVVSPDGSRVYVVPETRSAARSTVAG